MDAIYISDFMCACGRTNLRPASGYSAITFVLRHPRNCKSS